MSPFVIFSLPRSRSMWLSVLLSRKHIVGHDIGAECSTPEEFVWKLGVGSCETGAAFAWPLIRQMVPDVRFLVIVRPADEVIDSLERCGLMGVAEEVCAREKHLRALIREPGVLWTDWTALDSYSTCDGIHHFCFGEKLDYEWWDKLRHTNVQVDLDWQIDRLVQSRSAIEGLKADVHRRLEHA